MKTNIQEIFRSIQGEGAYAGRSAVFVRFSGCNLRCDYCDTKRSWRPAKYCNYQPVEFCRRNVRVPNDISAEDCADMIYWLAPSGLVCFTGGEPLLQAKYISAVIKLLGNKYTYLIETNGTIPSKLPAQKNIVYSVDLKSGQEQKFIKVWKTLPKQKYIKIILEKNLNIEKVAQTLNAIQPTEIYLQPESNRLDKNLLQRLMYIFDKTGYIYRMIPQLHKTLRLK